MEELDGHLSPHFREAVNLQVWLDLGTRLHFRWGFPALSEDSDSSRFAVLSLEWPQFLHVLMVTFCHLKKKKQVSKMPHGRPCWFSTCSQPCSHLGEPWTLDCSISSLDSFLFSVLPPSFHLKVLAIHRLLESDLTYVFASILVFRSLL